MYGYKPREIDDMTLSEIVMLLDDTTAPRPHGGRGVAQTAEEMADSARRWVAMSPHEKLAQAMRDHDD